MHKNTKRTIVFSSKGTLNLVSCMNARERFKIQGKYTRLYVNFFWHKNLDQTDLRLKILEDKRFFRYCDQRTASLLRWNSLSFATFHRYYVPHNDKNEFKGYTVTTSNTVFITLVFLFIVVCFNSILYSTTTSSKSTH